MRIAACSLVCVALVASNALAAAGGATPTPPKLPAALASASLCAPNGHLSMRTLVDAALYASNAKTKLTADAALPILAGPLSIDDPQIAQYPELADAAAYANAVLQSRWSAYFKTPSPAPSRQAYFQEMLQAAAEKREIRADWTITCLARSPLGVPQAVADPTHPSPLPADTAEGFRLRGTPADLVPGRDSDAFAGASKATINLSDNRVTAAKGGQLTGALGYFLPLVPGNIFGVMPYVAGNYNATKTGTAATKFASDTLDGGIYVAGVVHVAHDNVVTLAVAPDYLHNFADKSSIISLSPIITPKVVGLLNDSRHVTFLDWLPAVAFGPTSTGTYLTLFGDLRADLGHYTDHGVGPDVKTNLDFAEVGTRFGLDVAKDKWYDVNVADLQQYGFAGARRHIYDFESAFTYYGGTQNILGLTASYKSGFIERSLQKEEAWALGLTAKY